MKPMLIKGLPIFCDVDETLVTWEGIEYYPMQRNIDSLIRHSKRGHKVFVWSAGGWKWALMAVKALGLEEYVYAILDKPKWYLDDKDASEWSSRYWYDDRREKNGQDKSVNTDYQKLDAIIKGSVTISSPSCGLSDVLYPKTSNKDPRSKRK